MNRYIVLRGEHAWSINADFSYRIFDWIDVDPKAELNEQFWQYAMKMFKENDKALKIEPGDVFINNRHFTDREGHIFADSAPVIEHSLKKVWYGFIPGGCISNHKRSNRNFI